MTGKPDRLLTVAQVADLLATAETFPRRLIAERRIRFVRVGRHVRIPESAVAEFIATGTVEPVTAWHHRRRRRVAVRWPVTSPAPSRPSASCPRAGGRPATGAVTACCARRRTRSSARPTPPAGSP